MPSPASSTVPPDLSNIPQPGSPNYRKYILPTLGVAAVAMQKGSLPKAEAVVNTGKANGYPTQVRGTTKPLEKAMYPFSPLVQKASPTGHSIVVSIPDKRVIVLDKNGKEVRNFSAYVGTAASPTPRGQFRIMSNIVPDPNKEWYYGGHWMGFARDYDRPGSQSYAGFHGWVYDRDDDDEERKNPGWKTSTHGCVQLSNQDVADLSRLVGAGDPVTIVDTPLLPPQHPMFKPEVK